VCPFTGGIFLPGIAIGDDGLALSGVFQASPEATPGRRSCEILNIASAMPAVSKVLKPSDFAIGYAGHVL